MLSTVHVEKTSVPAPDAASEGERRPAPTRALGHTLAGAAVWVAAGLYMGATLTRGWIPHDDGALAQSAERMLRGELPHRDFVELYTGGLTLLHALAFRVLGTSLLSMRLVLFAFFLAWVPAVYYVASRLARPAGAALITLVAVAWSVPIYPAPMPSWYNLFFATFGLAALLRHVEDGRRRWLFVAGLCGAASFLVKVSGLFFIAGALLFLVFREQALVAAARGGSPPRAGWYRTLVGVLLAFFVALLWALVRHRARSAELFHFVLPGAAIAAAALWRTWTAPPRDGDRQRLVALLRLVVPFLGGVALPLILWAVWYAAEHALGPLVRGVFELPRQRLEHARQPMLPVLTTVSVLPLAWMIVAAPRLAGRDRWVILVGTACAAAAALVASTRYLGPYQVVMASARTILPVVAIAGAVSLAWHRARRAETPGGRLFEQRMAAVLCVAATCALVQYPFAAPVYFCYVAPLVLFAACAVVAASRPLPPGFAAVGLAFYLAFATLILQPSAIYSWWNRYRPVAMTDRLDGPRGGGLHVTALHGAENRELVRLVSARARPGSYIFAAPDCPQVYFMTGTRNPTRALFDFFEVPDGYDIGVLRMIDSLRIPLVVLNDSAKFSRKIEGPLADSLARRFPHAAPAGRFLVRWRD
ncbi:MAG: ArnT family glycosyltransferase [Gemmatimonadaceae bacterium]